MLRELLKRLTPSARASQPDAAALAREAADRLISDGDRAEVAGDRHEACLFYRKAVEAAPDYAKAHLNLGTGLEAIGDADGAIRSYETALAVESVNAYASYNLARLLYARGLLERANELLRSALVHKPEFPEALVVLSNVQDAQGSLVDAAATLEVALQMQPDGIGALLNYASVLKKLGRLTEAEHTLRRIVAIEPENADALYDLGGLCYARNAPKEAEMLLQLALRYRPDFPDAYGILFHVYEMQGHLNIAAAALEKALALRSDWVEALYNYGTTLRKLRRFGDAEMVLRRAIAIAPKFSLPYEALGGVYFGRGLVSEALAEVRKGRAVDPDRFSLESTELFILNHSDAISSNALFERHKMFGNRLQRAYPSRFAPFRNSKDPLRRLRIGYISGDFIHHPVTFFLLPLLERHDQSAVEIFCYMVGSNADEFTDRVKTLAGCWQRVSAQSATELADTISRDQIDILVDLSGHSGASRLAVFAQQPAPVQVAWLGYPNTSGLTRIQYRFCDAYTDPPGVTDKLHTETLFRVNGSQWCYQPILEREISPVPPCERNGYVTFGAFNQLKKLSPSAIRLWSEILVQLPDARLVVAGVPEPDIRDRLLRDFSNKGADTRKISFLPHVELGEYFRRFNDVDIALDPTPYSGCTTTFDTLWMGVPVLTLQGEHIASGVTAGILTALHLGEWIASTVEEYVQLAVKFSGETEMIRALRGTLRRRLRQSPLMDAPSFARNMEQAYRQIWQTWCNGGAH